MKYFIIIFSIYLAVFSFLLNPQEKEVREEMVVVNVEIPVRVLHKGKPVDNLNKSDFRLFENGKELPINGFHIVRKMISSQKIELDSEREQFYKPRFFVLAFSVTNFNRFYEKGVKYFFDNVLRTKDKLIVFINNTTLIYENLNEKEKIREKIILSLNREGKVARQNLRMSILTVENGVRNLINELNMTPWRRQEMVRAIKERAVLSFFTKYHMAWENYKRSFLRLNIYTLYNFATFLKRIQIEKWVISFYQFEKFPILNRNSAEGGKILPFMGGESSRIMRDVSTEFNAERYFPYEEVSKMFYNLGAIFNLVVIPTRIETDSSSISTINISTSIENTLREITRITGGSISFSSNLGESIEKIIKKEDIHYLLTYSPEDSSRRGRLKIRLKNINYKLLYDDNQRADFLKNKIEKYTATERMVKVEDLQFLDKKLSFKMINFELDKNKSKTGKVEANVIIKSNIGDILFDEKKTLNPDKESTEISIGFNWLTPGKYDLIIDVKDLLTNYKAFEYLKIEVK